MKVYHKIRAHKIKSPKRPAGRRPLSASAVIRRVFQPQPGEDQRDDRNGQKVPGKPAERLDENGIFKPRPRRRSRIRGDAMAQERHQHRIGDTDQTVSQVEGQTLEAKELIDFVGGKIARYKKPQYVEFVTDLPTLEDGSPDRAKIKALSS